MRCELAQATIAALAVGETPSSDRHAEHIARCLQCQVAVVSQRRVRSVLASLRDDVVTPDPALLNAVLNRLDAIADRDLRHAELVRRAAYLGGAAAAGGLVLAMAAGRLKPTAAWHLAGRLVG